MQDTFILVGPEHCLSHKTLIAKKFEELGVKNARNLVGRIGNLYFRHTRVAKSLADWECIRRTACQNLANSDDGNKIYQPADRPGIISEIKRARKLRDEWHYKTNLYSDVDRLMAELPALYITESELKEARRLQIQKIMVVYQRKRLFAKKKRQSRGRPVR